MSHFPQPRFFKKLGQRWAQYRSISKATYYRQVSPTTALDLTKNSRERVIILGSGWGGYVLSKNLDTRKFAPLVVSPRSYFVFTPLLNDCAVGTLEFRAALEPVRRNKSGVDFIQAWADDVNFLNKTVTVESSVLDPSVTNALTADRHAKPSDAQHNEKAPMFELGYDKLVIATGAYSQTFGTKGVKENAMFLKDIGDSRRIRRRILEVFELCVLPTTRDVVKRYLLHFVVIGGGPTGMEFAAALSDLIDDDLGRIYPKLKQYVKITVFDVAPRVLPMFDASLAEYAMEIYKRQRVEIKTSHHVEELRRGFPNDFRTEADHAKGGVYTLRTREDGDIGIGMCVWSTGNMMNPFVEKALSTVHQYPDASAVLLDPVGEHNTTNRHNWQIIRHAKTGAIVVNDQLQVQLQAQGSDHKARMTDVFAIGDTSTMASGPLPATAQVANQQALWLAARLNKQDIETKIFGFRNLGIMTYLGGAKAMIQSGGSRDGKTREIKGRTAFLLWRAAYMNMTLSWRNRILVPIYWLIVKVFGRDISRF